MTKCRDNCNGSSLCCHIFSSSYVLELEMVVLDLWKHLKSMERA